MADIQTLLENSKTNMMNMFKNRKYFFSAKDLALVEALTKDGFKIPQNFKKEELVSKYEVPKNLIQLIEKKQNAFLALKIAFRASSCSSFKVIFSLGE